MRDKQVFFWPAYLNTSSSSSIIFILLHHRLSLSSSWHTFITLLHFMLTCQHRHHLSFHETSSFHWFFFLIFTEINQIFTTRFPLRKWREVRIQACRYAGIQTDWQTDTHTCYPSYTHRILFFVYCETTFDFLPFRSPYLIFLPFRLHWHSVFSVRCGWNAE